MENIDVKVFKNLCDDIIEFETIDEFNNYYKINKAEIDKLSTRGINQKYKVKNHRIGREKGVTKFSSGNLAVFCSLAVVTAKLQNLAVRFCFI